MHEGAAYVFPFSRERGGGYFLAVVLGRFPEETRKRGVFVIANGNQYPRYGVYPFPEIGVQVMGNENRYPLVRWEWGGGRSIGSLFSTQ